MSDRGQASLFESEPPPDGRSPATAISVSALNHATQKLLEDRVPRLWVRGEISKWTIARSGHRYFTLRDDGAQVDCVLFQGDAWRLPADPEEGTEI
ncbi:MAG: exodeoxyribonuclease VII large subunit, partial [Gemmatimonadota bacterium]|nr:exodeoxyribonuclease VII large subunit [Gemmatimonadota bacterium]